MTFISTRCRGCRYVAMPGRADDSIHGKEITINITPSRCPICGGRLQDLWDTLSPEDRARRHKAIASHIHDS